MWKLTHFNTKEFIGVDGRKLYVAAYRGENSGPRFKIWFSGGNSKYSWFSGMNEAIRFASSITKTKLSNWKAS